MARRPARKSASKPVRHSASANSAAPETTRDKIVAAFMALLAEQRLEEIGFADIAEAAGVTLAQLREEFPSALAILAAYLKSVDRAVLAQDMADMAEEAAARAAVRRADAQARNHGAAARGGALAHALGAAAIRRLLWRSTGLRCARSNGC